MNGFRSLCLALCVSVFLTACAEYDIHAASDAKNDTTVILEAAAPEELSSEIPAYSGEPYAVINNNQPLFTDEEKENTDAFEHYSGLDELGRCGAAYANICRELMPTQERGAIGQIKPTGWQLVKYDFIDGKYLYNRCHLIGYQLAGENANEKNLITGTRYLNIVGMLPFENEVADYVRETDHHVLYRVTPIFEGDNLLASGVRMEAYSVEDDGAGICFHVFAYNCQPGVDLDYATGESRLSEESPLETALETTLETALQEESIFSENSADAATYILNTNTKKFHLPSCASVGEMSEHNKKEVTASREEIIEQGYVPCKRCNP